MKLQESINRGFNLLATSIVGLAGFAFLPEVFFEKDVPDKIDDFALFILAIVAIAWYNKKENRYARNSLPLVLIGIALVVKIAGLIIEMDDAEAVGDDFGGVLLLLLSFGLVWKQYKKTKKLLAEAGKTA